MFSFQVYFRIYIAIRASDGDGDVCDGNASSPVPSETGREMIMCALIEHKYDVVFARSLALP